MKLNGIDLNKLNVFCAVIQHGSYRLASEELHLTKAAISQSIKALEGSLGKSLFLRNGGRLQPTSEALRFHADLLPFKSQLNRALENLVGGSQEMAGELCVGAYFEFTKSKLMPVVESFLIDFDKARLRFRFESPSRLNQLLKDQRIDLSLSIFPHQGSKSIRSEPLFKEELVLVAPFGTVSGQVTLEKIKSLRLIDYFSGHVLFKRWCSHFYPGINWEPKVRAYAATAEMVASMVARGLGMGVVPRYVAEPYLKASKIQFIAPNDDLLYDYIWLNEWTQASPPPLQKEFVQRLRQKFSPKDLAK